ncbi:hypothetical protein UFOVP594_12 [uncultured Caudovirales phage]|uniref:Holin n=1 Tax=uncultured Caudovirales phage TaxID=2100421 RepID=A0A6J5N287_9CAUD|nr:hypothetical protein UFOVP594_12 [uncultured Caudovirales phage]
MVLVTTGIVEILKKVTGLAGNLIPVISMGVGFLVVYVGVGGVYNTQVLAVGILVGLAASGGFEALKRIIKIFKGDFGVGIGPKTDVQS